MVKDTRCRAVSELRLASFRHSRPIGSVPPAAIPSAGRPCRYRPALISSAPRSSCASLLIQLELTRNLVRSVISRLRRKTGTFSALSAFLLLGSCVPWTVRPIDQTDSSSGQARTFDAVRYVDSIWNSRVLPAVAASAVDLREALQAHPAGCLLVKGEGRVLRVDTSSRSGLMLLDLAPYDGRADAAIQIGPVIRGTVLRDALPFIQFSQFVNQLEFARVSNALNDRVVQSVLVSLPKAGLEGSVVSFSGASRQPAANELPEIVPVILIVKGKL